MSSKRLNTVTLLVAITAFQFGCDTSEQTENLVESVATISNVAQAEPVEVFVFMAPVEFQNVKHQLEDQVLMKLTGGSMCHLIECPAHRVIASVSVPYGSAKSRVRNRQFQNEFARVAEYFEEQNKPDEINQIGLPAVAETVANLRQTDLECRIVLCGSPIFDDPQYSTFSMARGLVPSDGLIGHPHSPWVLEPALPANTQLSWLTSGIRWGVSSGHRKRISRFNRLYIKLLGGHVVRITPDPKLAFSFSEPHLKNDVVKRNEEAVMIDPQIETKLFDDGEEKQPHIIQVKKPRGSFSKPGTLKHKIEMDGGDPDALAGESIVLWLVYDGSGSMAAHIEQCNRTVLKIAESLPELVKSLEIGIAVHRENETNILPIVQINEQAKDGGNSLKKVAEFLKDIQANGEDALTEKMLIHGMSQLIDAGAGKRQFLMLIGDHAEFGAADQDAFQLSAARLLKKTKAWSNERGTNRRVIGMYSGPEGLLEEFFRNLGESNPKSVFTRNPDDLIDALLEAAIQKDD